MRRLAVPVYRALTVLEAQHLEELLKRAGIESFADDTETPLYGTQPGPPTWLVRVWSVDSDRALDIVEEFQRQGHPGFSMGGEARDEIGPTPVHRGGPADRDPHKPCGPGVEGQIVELQARFQHPTSAEARWLGAQFGYRRSTEVVKS